MAIDPIRPPNRIHRIVRRATGQVAPRAGFLLLLSLLLLLAAAPFVQEHSAGMLIEKALFTTMLVAAMAIDGKRGLTVAALLVAPAIVFSWFHQIQPSTMTRIVTCSAGAVFIAWVVWKLIRSLLLSRRVGADVLCAALSTYLLLGVIWGMLYSIVQEALPGSFNLPPPASPHNLVRFELIYFSFVTLCTVGYGDIVPATPPARMLAMLEAIVGMIFTTILLARLVSLYAAEQTREHSGDR